MNIITGSGRSGTSFVATIIDKLAGLVGDFGWEESVRAGMETKEIVDLNKMLFYVNGKESPYSNIWLDHQEVEKAKHAVGSILKSASEPFFGRWVKDPLFSKTLQIWIDSGVPVEMLIVCTRQPYKSMQSAKRVNRGFEPASSFSESVIETEMHARQGYLWDTILRYGVPYAVVRYEHMLEDLPAVLGTIFPEYDKEALTQLVSNDWKPNQP